MTANGRRPSRQITVPADFALNDQEIIAILTLCEAAKNHAVGGEVILSWERGAIARRVTYFRDEREHVRVDPTKVSIGGLPLPKQF